MCVGVAGVGVVGVDVVSAAAVGEGFVCIVRAGGLAPPPPPDESPSNTSNAEKTTGIICGKNPA